MRAKKNTTHRFNNFVDQLNACSDFVVRVSSNETMKIFLGILGVLFWSGLALLDTALATNADLRSTIALHLLQTVATWTDEETEKVYLGELLNRDIDLLGGALRSLHLVVFDWGTEVGVVLHGTVDETDTLVFEFLTVSDLARVGTATVGVIRGRRGRRTGRNCISLDYFEG